MTNSKSSHRRGFGSAPSRSFYNKSNRVEKPSKPSFINTTNELRRKFPTVPTGPSRPSVPQSIAPTLERRETKREDRGERILSASSQPNTSCITESHDSHFSESEEEEGSLFSGRSQSYPVGNPEQTAVSRDLRLSARIAALLPAEIWAQILPLLHPVDLARLRQCSKLFQKITSLEAIWKRSRENHIPDLPKPLRGFSEGQMLNVYFGRGCMFCNASEYATLWQFGKRCCMNCLLAQTENETTLLAQNYPNIRVLLDLLPYAVLDPSGRLLPDPSYNKIPPGCTKIYWSAGVKYAIEELLYAQGLLAGDEWLRGREVDLDSRIRSYRKIPYLEKRRPALLEAVHQYMAQFDGARASPSESSRDTTAKTVKAEDEPSDDDTANLQGVSPKVKSRPDEACRTGSGKASTDNQHGPGTDKQLPDRQDRSGDNRIPAIIDTGLSVSPTRKFLLGQSEVMVQAWKGRLTKRNCTNFASNVLLFCRRAFLQNEETRRRRLTINDMKYLYITVIKPLVLPFHPKMEIFLCKGCPNNPRWWDLEPLMQHYFAKHLSSARGSPGRVNWEMSWPDIDPFRAESSEGFLPSIADAQNKPAPIEAEAAKASDQLRSNNTESHDKQIVDKCTQDVSADNEESQLVSRHHSTRRQDMLAAVLRDLEESWYLVDGLEGLQPSVHVHFAIIRTARKFQSAFAQALPLSLFREAVHEYPSLKPLGGAQDLGCLACWKGQGGDPHYQTTSSSRIFSLTALVQHFQTVHIERADPGVVLDWTRSMVKLPHPRHISALAQSKGINDAKRRSLEDVFPWAFTIRHARSKSDAQKTSVSENAGSNAVEKETLPARNPGVEGTHSGNDPARPRGSDADDRAISARLSVPFDANGADPHDHRQEANSSGPGVTSMEWRPERQSAQEPSRPEQTVTRDPHPSPGNHPERLRNYPAGEGDDFPHGPYSPDDQTRPAQDRRPLPGYYDRPPSTIPFQGQLPAFRDVHDEYVRRREGYIPGELDRQRVGDPRRYSASARRERSRSPPAHAEPYRERPIYRSYDGWGMDYMRGYDEYGAYEQYRRGPPPPPPHRQPAHHPPPDSRIPYYPFPTHSMSAEIAPHHGAIPYGPPYAVPIEGDSRIPEAEYYRKYYR